MSRFPAQTSVSDPFMDAAMAALADDGAESAPDLFMDAALAALSDVPTVGRKVAPGEVVPAGFPGGVQNVPVPQAPTPQPSPLTQFTRAAAGIAPSVVGPFFNPQTEDIGAGLATGTGQAVSQVGGAMEAVGNVLPGALGQRMQRAGSETVQMGVDDTTQFPQPTTRAGQLAQSVPGLVAAVGAGALTGGIGGIGGVAVGAGMAGAQSGGQQYNDAKARVLAQGGTPEQARQVATTEAGPMALFSAATSVVPMGRYLNRFAPGVLNKAVGRLSQRASFRLLGDAAAEGSQEAAEELASMTLQAIAEDDPEAFRDWGTRLATAGAGGAILGGGLGATLDIAGRIGGTRGVQDAQLPAPAAVAQRGNVESAAQVATGVPVGDAGAAGAVEQAQPGVRVPPPAVNPLTMSDAEVEAMLERLEANQPDLVASNLDASATQSGTENTQVPAQVDQYSPSTPQYERRETIDDTPNTDSIQGQDSQPVRDTNALAEPVASPDPTPLPPVDDALAAPVEQVAAQSEQGVKQPTTLAEWQAEARRLGVSPKGSLGMVQRRVRAARGSNTAKEVVQQLVPVSAGASQALDGATALESVDPTSHEAADSSVASPTVPPAGREETADERFVRLRDEGEEIRYMARLVKDEEADRAAWNKAVTTKGSKVSHTKGEFVNGTVEVPRNSRGLVGVRGDFAINGERVTNGLRFYKDDTLDQSVADERTEPFKFPAPPLAAKVSGQDAVVPPSTLAEVRDSNTAQVRRPRQTSKAKPNAASPRPASPGVVQGSTSGEGTPTVPSDETQTRRQDVGTRSRTGPRDRSRQQADTRKGAGQPAKPEQGRGRETRFSAADIDRRIAAKVKETDLHTSVQDYNSASLNVDSESGVGSADGGSPFDTTFAGSRLPGEVRTWLEGRFQYRKYFKTNTKGGTGEDSLRRLGPDRYFAMLEEIVNKSGVIDNAARKLKGMDPALDFLVWLKDSMPVNKDRPPYSVVDNPGSMADGTRVEIVGTKFEVVHDEDGPVYLIERDANGEPMDDIEPKAFDLRAFDELPVDDGSTNRAATPKPYTANFGEQKRDLLGQAFSEPMTGKQRGLLDVGPDPDQQAKYPGIREGESVSAYEKRMGTADTPTMFKPLASNPRRRGAAINPIEEVVDIIKRARAQGQKAQATPARDVAKIEARAARQAERRLRRAESSNAKLAEQLGESNDVKRAYREVLRESRRDLQTARQSIVGIGSKMQVVNERLSMAQREKDAAEKMTKTVAKGAADTARIEQRAARQSEREIAALEAANEKAALAKQAREVVVKVAQTLPVRLRGNLITDVRDAKTIADVYRAASKAQDAVAREIGREARTTIQRYTRTAVTKRLSDAARERLDAISLKAADAIRRFEAPLASAGDAAIELADLADQAKGVVHEYRMENKLIREGQFWDAELDRQKVVDSLVNVKQLPMDRSGKGRKQPMRYGVTNLWRANMNARTIAKVLDGFKDGPVTRLIEGIQGGQMQRFELSEAATEQANVAAHKAGFSNLSELMAATSDALGEGPTIRKTVKLGGRDFTLTLGELAKLYSTEQDVNTRNLIAAGKPIQFRTGGKFSDPIRLTPEDFATVAAAIPEEIKTAIDSMKATRDRMFPAVQKVIRVLKGYEPPKEPGYEPRFVNREMSGASTDAELTPDLSGMIEKHIENAGFTIQRVQDKTNPLIIGDFFHDWVRSINGQADVIALATPIANARKVLMHPTTKKAIADRYGDVATERIRGILVDAAGLRADPGSLTAAIQRLTRNVSYARTSLRPTSWLIQIAGVPRLAAEMPGSAFSAGVRGAFSPDVGRRMMEGSPLLRKRYSGTLASINTSLGDPSSAVAVQSEGTLRERMGEMGRAAKAAGQDIAKGNVGGAFGKALPEVFDGIRISNFFDSIPARIAWAGFEAEAKRQGHDQAWVRQQAEKALRSVLNSSDPLELTGFGSNLRNSPLVPMTAFTTDAASAWNQVYQGWGESRQKGLKATAGVVAGALWASAITGTAGYLSAAAMGDDEEKAKQRALEGAVTRFIQETVGMGFVEGKIADLAAAGAKGFDVSVADAPMIGAINQTIRSVGGLASAIYDKLASDDPEKVETASRRMVDSLMRVVEFGGSLAGNPTTPQVSAARKAIVGKMKESE